MFLIAFLFWLCMAHLLYIYVGYPFLVTILAKLFGRKCDQDEAFQPSVSLLISAYNEASVIEAKIQNSLALHYPPDLLEIIVISDCSEDGTDNLVSGFGPRGVRLIRQNQRLGKSAALNFAVPQARGQVLVFSDANAIYQPEAVRLLVRHFSNAKVGYVVGNARYYESGEESSSAKSESLYWKLETYLKAKESSFASVVGGDGAIYAIRRELFTPLQATDINDFLNPLQIIGRGYDGVYESRSICYEEAAKSFALEYQRKVRIISRSLNALRRIPAVLNPFGNPRHWLVLISHKVLRWFAPFSMILLLFLSLMLWQHPFYRVAALSQLVFYLMAVFGSLWHTKRFIGKAFALPFYFCLVNLASLVGCVRCLRGNLSSQWAPPRQKVAG
jgi:cellulose synthase/poly-beta-1,6-N-acetylglucosamine synthase-like glycosyltransferase